MPTANTRALYWRLSVLAFLSAGLIFFLSAPATETAFAMGCLEDCEPLEQQCVDGCPADCASDDTSCDDCITQCSQFRNWCNRTSTMCGSGSMFYSPNCSVEFGQHCLIGEPCDTAHGAHQGY